MKQLLFGIFAHPDDEAFGPSAYLYRRAQAGTDVHLVLVTDGAAGRNDGYDDLADTRYQEWLESGRRIGAASNKALRYADGSLHNSVYLEICEKILDHIHTTLAGYHEPVELDFITFEERGITGHLDHIAVSFMTTYIFEKLKRETPGHAAMGVLRYYCIPRAMAPECNCDWLYMPAGRDKIEIDETHVYNDLSDAKLHIMQAHESQKHDMEAVLSFHEHAAETSGNDPKICLADHFIVRH